MHAPQGVPTIKDYLRSRGAGNPLRPFIARDTQLTREYYKRYPQAPETIAANKPFWDKFKHIDLKQLLATPYRGLERGGAPSTLEINRPLSATQVAERR